MSLLNSAVQIPTVSEVPAGLIFEDKVDHSALITNRQTVRAYPLGSDTYSNSGIRNIQFRLSSFDSFLDASTLALNFSLTTPVNTTWDEQSATNPNGNGLTKLGASVANIISEVRIKIAGILVETISDFQTLKAMLNVSSVDKGYLSSVGNATEGCWRNVPEATILSAENPAVTGLDTSYLCLAPNSKNQAQMRNYKSTINAGTATSYDPTYSYYSLSLDLCGLSRLNKYHPLPHYQDLTIEVVLEKDYGRAFLQNPVNSSEMNYQVTKASLSYDLVSVNPQYSALLSRMIAGSGVVLHIDSYNTQKVQVSPGVVGGPASERTITVTKGLSDLKSVFAVFKRRDEYADPRVHSVSDFPRLGWEEHQWTVNSQQFPATPVQSIPESFVELEKSLGKYGNVLGASSLDYKKYINQPLLALPYTDPNAKPSSEAIMDAFIIGQNLERSTSDGSSSGLNTNLAGNQIQLRVKMNPLNGSGTQPAEAVCCMFLHHNVAIVLANNTVQISV